MLGALAAAGAAGAVAEGAAFLLSALSSRPLGPATTAREGGALFLAFHRVILGFDVPRALVPGVREAGFPFAGARVTATLAATGGTVLVLWLLSRAGRAVAERVGGSTWGRALQGAKPALPYAAACLAVSAEARFSVPVGPGVLAVRPSPVAAGLWGLGLAALAGAGAGIRSGPVPTGPRPAPARVARAGVVGAGWMVALGLILAFVGLSLLAPFHPGATRAYFRPFAAGLGPGAAGVLATLLVLPTLASWVLLPSMGGCVSTTAEVAGRGFSTCLLSYRRLPGPDLLGALAGFRPTFARPTWPYLLFALVPLAAAVAGGWTAVRRGRLRSRGEVLAAGTLAGVLGGAGVGLAAVLSGLAVAVSGPVPGLAGSAALRVGPEVLSGLALAAGWGVVGASIGALGAGWRLGRSGDEAEETGRRAEEAGPEESGLEGREAGPEPGEAGLEQGQPAERDRPAEEAPPGPA